MTGRQSQVPAQLAFEEALAETGKANEHSEGMGTIPNPIFPLALNVFIQMPQTSMLGHMALIYCFSFSLKTDHFLSHFFYFIFCLFYFI